MKLILSLLMIGIFAVSPLYAQAVVLKQKFEVTKNEPVKIANTNLEIKFLSNGHLTYFDWSHTYFCKFEARLNGTIKERELNLGESLTFENLNIRLVGLKETHLKDDLTWSLPSCKFIVTKIKK